MKERIALIPGTFDPVTVGHMELIKTASALFDRVVVCILTNPAKTHLFSEEKRLELLRLATADYKNVTVDADHGYTADYAARIGADYIIRGIRNEVDAKYELEMAEFNRARTGVTTLFLPSPEALSDVSSTRVREALAKGERTESILPEEIKNAL